MVTPSVSEAARLTRNEMAMASAELAFAFEAVADRLDAGTPNAFIVRLASNARRLAALFQRLEVEAQGGRVVDELTLRSLGRVYEDMGIKLWEISEFVDFLESAVALAQIEQKLRRVGELAGQALLLFDVRLS